MKYELNAFDWNQIQIKINQKSSFDLAFFSEKCLCGLWKEHIVENFTMMEKNINQTNEIIEVFAKFENPDDDTRKELLHFLTIEEENKQNECLLRFVLADKEGGLRLCLLERELRRTNQTSLLKKILRQKPKDSKTFNFSGTQLLLKCLEKHFLSYFPGTITNCVHETSNR